VFQKDELKIAMYRRGVTNEALAKAAGINTSSLYRKMTGQTDFYRCEIVKIAEFLHLDDEEFRRIFFAPELA